jgi:D-serine deaminase-like pyridoxal phosphate-dependent protein
VKRPIAKYQLKTGSIGICCAKLSEAEALVAHDVDRILMTTSNPSKSKIRNNRVEVVWGVTARGKSQ